MSATHRMPVVAGTLGLAAAVVSAVFVPSVRNGLDRVLGLSAPGGFWRIAAVAFALLNLKNIPFVWHWRIFRQILYHVYLAPVPLKRADLFKPAITESYNSILDCDYNLHKSNSTYFADFDAARSSLFSAIVRTSLDKFNAGDLTGLSEDAKKLKGTFGIALGSVGAVFKKEIKPLETYEMWTKLLSWDNKWFYLITHVVKKGAKRPTSYAMQPWKKGARSKSGAEANRDWQKDIYCTSLAKYVVKKGRLTIPPETVLIRSDLLPPKPAGAPSPVPAADTPALGTETPSNLKSPESLAAEVSEKLGAQASQISTESVENDEMTWEDVEKQRLKGLELAKHFDALSALHGEFIAEDEVLGRYPDFWW